MTERTWWVKAGVTPAKLAMVCVLAVVLVAVLWSQLGGGAQDIAKKPRREKSTPTKVEQPQPAKPVVSSTVVSEKERVWPKFELDSITKTDPFAMPMWYLIAHAEDEASAAGSLVRSAQVLEELRKLQTKIVVITGEDRVATIGDQSLRVGDTIEGFEVSKITKDGIVLTEPAR